ncbi:hypothetical protein BZL29_4031 [Mycobacterium kansasii]|uniref:Uncharacterized protein n=1 Tax=Mycobacterium kansasii TaxID=1768 RepID=A0A1V3XD57_MYCKA|nr:hypothetical protein BZL29_4031 [Mycobacterium kansasii]
MLTHRRRARCRRVGAGSRLVFMRLCAILRPCAAATGPAGKPGNLNLE